MRRPTPFYDLYEWHKKSLLGLNPEIVDGDPQCGWYRCKMVSGGPWVSARIRMYQLIHAITGELITDERLICEVNLHNRDPVEMWSYLAKNPISEDAHTALSLFQKNDFMEATHAPIDLANTVIEP